MSRKETEFVLPESRIIYESDKVIKYSADYIQGIRESVYYKSLNHPNIIKCDSVEFVKEGNRTLVKIIFIRYVSIDKIQFTPKLASQMFREIADALAYLEANQILQSDVKEGNIFYDQDLKIFVLADFDLAYYTTECFINRTATPLTRPPEVAIVTLEEEKYWEDIRPYRRYQTSFDRRSPYKNALSNWKGDVFSLGIVVSTILADKDWFPNRDSLRGWYSPELTDQVNEQDYQRRLNKILKEISDYEYFDLLKQCLEFDYQKRPSPTELSKDLGIAKVYSSCQMIPQDTFNLYEIIYEDISHYEKYNAEKDAIVRKKKSSRMFATYFSLKNRLPKDILEYALVMSSVLFLSALLCFEDSSFYPNNILDHFILFSGKEMFWAHEENEEPKTYFKLLGSYNETPEDFMKKFDSLGVENIFDVCRTLDFHLLF
jgi:serine/threonine protein kinase